MTTPQDNRGTGNPKYEQTLDPDSTPGSRTYFQIITAMPAYKNFSFEELRFQDYALGKKYATSSSGATGAFGQTTTFGGAGTTGGFGSTTSPFGQQPQQQATGGFGAPSTGAFGTTSTGLKFFFFLLFYFIQRIKTIVKSCRIKQNANSYFTSILSPPFFFKDYSVNLVQLLHLYSVQHLLLALLDLVLLHNHLHLVLPQGQLKQDLDLVLTLLQLLNLQDLDLVHLLLLLQQLLHLVQ